MIRQALLSGLVVSVVSLSACGGGAGSTEAATDAPASSASPITGKVAGPLDTMQSSLSQSVLLPLEDAAAGTALAATLACANKAVTDNSLDAIDSILNGLANPPDLINTTPAQLAGQVLQMSQNLSAMLHSLAGDLTCVPTTVLAGNPLVGTPFEPLGAALSPVLLQIQLQLGGTSAGQNGYAQLAVLVMQLKVAFASGVAQLPSSVTAPPIVGGLLTTVNASLGDLSSVFNALAANNPAALSTAVQATVDHLLVNLLTKVVPVDVIETQAGQPGLISNAIVQASAQFTAPLGTLTQPLGNLLGSNQLQLVLNPVINQVLPAVLTPISNALATVPPAPGGAPIPMETLLAPVSISLTALIGLGTVGNPAPVCIFAGTPLAILCR